MAHPIPTYAQLHGTLVPGQTISVNKYTVQVERYLSQGEPHRLNCDRPFQEHNRLPTATQPQAVLLTFISCGLGRQSMGRRIMFLKRIAVANDSMLTEVKKEVDIMASTHFTMATTTHLSALQRILKGHPNIVHLIDASVAQAIQREPTEFFILMEFCPVRK